MSYLFTFISACAVVMGLFFIKNEDISIRENFYFTGICMTSAVWSFGYGMMAAGSSPAWGNIWRGVAVTGVMFFFWFVMQEVAIWTGTASKYMTTIRRAQLAVTVILCPVFIFFLKPVYTKTLYGYFFTEKNFAVRTLYAAYAMYVFVIVIFMAILALHRREEKRIRNICINIIVSFSGAFAGYIFDIIWSLTGNVSFHMGTVLQFMGVVYMYMVLWRFNSDRVTVENYAGYVLRSMDIPVLVLNKNGCVNIKNKCAERFLNQQKIAGMPLAELFDMSMAELFSIDMSAVKSSVCTVNGKQCELEIKQIKDEYLECLGYIVVIKDTTERDELKSQLEELENKVERVYEEKKDFINNIDKEIRTPVNYLLGVDEMILMEATTDSIKEYASNIKRVGRSVISIVNTILGDTHIEGNDEELSEAEYDTSTLISDVVNMVSIKINEKKIPFAYEIADDMPCRLSGDATRLRSLLNSVLTEAVNATSQGQMVFKVYWTKCGDDRIEITAETEYTGNNTYENSQNDENVEGEEISQTAKIRELVDKLNGRLNVESEMEIGTIVTIYVKQKVTDAAPIGDFRKRYEKTMLLENPEQINFTAEDARVLFVNDVKSDIEDARDMLRATGVNLEAVSIGKEAVELAEMTEYDLLVIKDELVDLSGREILHSIRNDENGKSAGAKAVVLLEKADAEYSEELIRSGFEECFVRPLDIKTMLNIIKKWIPADKIQLVEMVQNSVSVSEAAHGNIEEVIEAADENDVIESQLKNMLMKEDNAADIEENKKFVFEHIEEETGLGFVGGDMRTFEDMLEIFEENGHLFKNQMVTAFEDTDWKSYVKYAQALKGNAAAVGAMKLFEIVDSLEAAVKNEKYLYIIENHDKMEREIEAVLNEIKEYFREKTIRR